MNTQELKQAIDGVEARADEAKAALNSGNVQPELRQAVEAFHQQASQAKKSGATDEESLRNAVFQIEEAADKALEACRNAGDVDEKLKNAIKGAHDQARNLKKQVQAEGAH
jgi:small-conductance mechanosensitive channel